jgi:tetratricopeptide (TPR) repeat protein
MRERGLLPPQLHIAVDCVGAVPYYSDFRTLDRLGLTDAHVGHSKRVRDVMAHGKSASLEYGRASGVHLWSEDPVHLIQPATSLQLLLAVRDQDQPPRGYDVVDAGEDGFLACKLPQGREATQRVLGRTRVYSLGDSAFKRLYLERARRAWRDSLAARPGDLGAARQLGYVLMLAEDYTGAVELYGAMTQRAPALVEALENLGIAEFQLGRVGAALEHTAQALAQARRQANEPAAARIADRLASVSSLLPSARSSGARPR